MEKYYQPKSLYLLSLEKFVTNTMLDVKGLLDHPLVKYLPPSIQRDLRHKVTLCDICDKLHIEETYTVMHTTMYESYQESRVCKSCLESRQCECWACAQRIEVREYVEFTNKFKSFSRIYEIPAIMTDYVEHDSNLHVTLCHRCDGFFWPCDKCGAWINEA